MSKKTITLVVSLVLALALGLGGTLAFLTDRDSDVNIFTVGNVDIDLTEDFIQGSELIPGVNIDKRPTITNEGSTDAWVWMTWSIPTALDEAIQGSEIGSDKNVVHWNPLGATTEGYVTETRVNNAIAAGYLPEGITAEEILANKMTWNVFNSLGEGLNMVSETIDGVEYNTYVLLYNKALEPGEETLPSVYNVYLDPHIDIAPDGQFYHVVNGETEMLDWNINEDKDLKILVAAYAIQKQGFETVEDAFAAYADQWGLDPEAGKVGNANFVDPTIIGSDAELAEALEEIQENEENWNTPIALTLAEGTYSDIHTINIYPEWNGTVGNGTSGNNMAALNGNENVLDLTIVGSGDVVFTNEVVVNGFGNAQNGFTNADGSVTFENIIFDGGDDNHIVVNLLAAASNVTFKNCTFKNSTHITVGGSGSNSVGSVTFENCEMDNGNCISGYYVDLTVNDTTVTNAYKGFVNNQSGNSTVTVNNCDVECSEYAFRTKGAPITINASDSSFVIDEADGAQYLVNFRGAGNATFDDCTMNVETCTSNGTVTIK